MKSISSSSLITPSAVISIKRSLRSVSYTHLDVYKRQLEGKETPARYKSQITLARRRIQAFTIALSLIERELDQMAE